MIAMRHMRDRLNNLTKPVGSLGLLEELIIRLAGITGKVEPDIEHKAVVIMCGDHGVVEEGVSAYPQAVTGLMIDNFRRGGAAINALTGQSGARLHIVDVGTKAENVPEGIVNRKIRPGTGNIANGPAMTKQETLSAIHVGIEATFSLADDGIRLIGLGEMGIGNTTPSCAIAAVFTGESADTLTGHGTGIDNNTLAAKIKVIERAITINQPDPGDPLDVLSKVGGLEIAALTGVILSLENWSACSPS